VEGVGLVDAVLVLVSLLVPDDPVDGVAAGAGVAVSPFRSFWPSAGFAADSGGVGGFILSE